MLPKASLGPAGFAREPHHRGLSEFVEARVCLQPELKLLDRTEMALRSCIEVFLKRGTPQSRAPDAPMSETVVVCRTRGLEHEFPDRLI